jgi:hypothetical protein
MKFKKEPGGNTKGNLVGHAGSAKASPKRKTVVATGVATKGNTPVVGKAEKVARVAVNKLIK